PCVTVFPYTTLFRSSCGGSRSEIRRSCREFLAPRSINSCRSSGSRTSRNLKTRSETTRPANKSSFCLSRRPHEDEQHNLIGRPASRLALFLYDLGPMAEWNAGSENLAKEAARGRKNTLARKTIPHRCKSAPVSV